MARAYEHWDEMLETETPDAAWVCTPPLGHTEPAIAALERRVHVYLEKPIARTLPDAERMVAAMTCIEAIYVVGYRFRALEFHDHIHNALAHRGTRRRRTRGRRPRKVDVRRAGRLCGAQ
jgi:predicted dehydrogenase